LYLAPQFVETEAEFAPLKPQMVRVGDVKTSENFVVDVPATMMSSGTLPSSFGAKRQPVHHGSKVPLTQTLACVDCSKHPTIDSAPSPNTGERQ